MYKNELRKCFEKKLKKFGKKIIKSEKNNLI